jgi:hypothetical protein
VIYICSAILCEEELWDRARGSLQERDLSVLGEGRLAHEPATGDHGHLASQGGQLGGTDGLDVAREGGSVYGEQRYREGKSSREGWTDE